MNSAAQTDAPLAKQLPTGGWTYTAAGLAKLLGLPIDKPEWAALPSSEQRRLVGEAMRARRAL